MRATSSLAVAAAVLGLASCANLERSRALDDPRVAAPVIAQQVCSNCHGVDGNSVSPNFPNLAAQTEPYFVEQMKGFRAHSRSDPAGYEYMWGLSAHLTDGQIDALARYFASQALHRTASGAAAPVVAAGRKLFEEGIPEKHVPACHSCHGDRGQGNGQFPRIAGQHADYIEKQLGVFQRTDQRPEGAVMKVVAHELSGTDIAQVAAYLEGLTLP